MLVTHSDGNADATKTSTYLGRPAQSGRHVGPDRTVRLRHDLGGMHRSLIEKAHRSLVYISQTTCPYPAWNTLMPSCDFSLGDSMAGMCFLALSVSGA